VHQLEIKVLDIFKAVRCKKCVFDTACLVFLCDFCSKHFSLR